jgi:hypothetical protein
MTYAISWARPKKERKAAVTALAVTMLSAGCIGAAFAQQPATPAAPATPAKPAAARRAPKPAAPKAPAAVRPAATAPAPTAQAGAPGPAPEMPQLIYSPWAKFCGKGKDDATKQVCFTGKDARTEAGQPVIAARRSEGLRRAAEEAAGRVAEARRRGP